MADEMRISELSRRCDVPVATIKYYLRTGLLHAGRSTGATQALYAQGHVDRLRLVRALIDVAGLSHAQIAPVLDAVDDPTSNPQQALARVHDALDNTHVDSATPRRAFAYLRAIGWQVDPDWSALRQLDQALEAAASVGVEVDTQRMQAYTEAARALAYADLGALSRESSQQAATDAALGSVLLEPVLVLLRRIAQREAVNRLHTRLPPGAVARTVQSTPDGQTRVTVAS